MSRSFTRAAAVVSFCCAALWVYPARAQAPTPGSPAPSIDGIGLDGRRHGLADLKSPRKLVYFFRPFPKCLDELLMLANMQRAAANEFQVIAVGPYPADEQRLRTETSLADLPFPVVLGGEEQVKAYGLNAGPFPPALFVISDSAVAAVRFGFSPDMTEFLRANGIPLYGSIRVATQPEGCKVLVDGQQMENTTPLTLEKLPEGSHKVSLSKDGWQPKEVSVAVTAEGIAEIKESLQPAAQRSPASAQTTGCTWRGTVPPAAGGMLTSLLRPKYGRRMVEQAERGIRVELLGVGACRRTPGVPVKAQYAVREGGVFEFPASAAGKTVEITFQCRLARAGLLLTGDITYYDPGGKGLALAVAAEFTANKYQEMAVGDVVQAALEQEHIRPTAAPLSESRVKDVVARLEVEELVRLKTRRRGGELELTAEIYGPEGRLWASEDDDPAQAVRVPLRSLTTASDRGQARSAVRRLFESWFSS